MHDDASHFRSATIFHARTFHVPSREILRFAKRTRTVNRVERPTAQGYRIRKNRDEETFHFRIKKKKKVTPSFGKSGIRFEIS